MEKLHIWDVLSGKIEQHVGWRLYKEDNPELEEKGEYKIWHGH
jgi:hypothetical protein